MSSNSIHTKLMTNQVTTTNQVTPTKNLKREHNSRELLEIQEAILNMDSLNQWTENNDHLVKKIKISHEPDAVLSAKNEFFIPFNSSIVPSTPKKNSVRRTPSAISKMATSPFHNLFQEAQDGKFQIKGENVKLTFLNQGSYMNAYDIVGQDDLVAKLYHGRKSGFNQTTLEGYMKTSINNYYTATNLNLPVATITNIKTALQDRFFLQKKMANEVDLNSNLQLQQVREFFIISLKNNVILDLSPQNLLIDNGGIVTLIDFIEDKDEILSLVIIQCLTNWCKKYMSSNNLDVRGEKDRSLVEKFLLDFTEGFGPSYTQEHHQTILGRVLFVVKSSDFKDL